MSFPMSSLISSQNIIPNIIPEYHPRISSQNIIPNKCHFAKIFSHVETFWNVFFVIFCENLFGIFFVIFVFAKRFFGSVIFGELWLYPGGDFKSVYGGVFLFFVIFVFAKRFWRGCDYIVEGFVIILEGEYFQGGRWRVFLFFCYFFVIFLLFL